MRGRAAKAWWYLRSALGGSRLTVGRGLSLGGRLTIRGPGTVRLGDHVRVDRATVLYTLRPDAVIEIGDEVNLNGPRISAAARVSVGADCMLGDGRITDTDYHHTSRRRRDGLGPSPAKEVAIGSNVWLGGSVGVLKGVTIGDNAVVGFGAVVTRDVPPDRMVAGNPARDIGPVPE